MLIYVKLLILIGAIFQFVYGNNDNFSLELPNQQSLANLLFSSRLNSKDPQATLICFANYMSKLNKVGEEYKQNYTNCLFVAKESRTKMERSMSSTREQLVENSQELCRRWENCNTQNMTLDLLMCHSREGTTNVRNVYTISDIADEYANKLLAGYRETEANYEHCRKLAERKYGEMSTEVYHSLKECLKG